MTTSRMIIGLVWGPGLLSILPSIALASCGSAFCTVNSNWTSESATLEPGSTLDLRFETIDQDQPRTGRKKVAVGAIPRHHDEVSTVNRNLLATFSHTFDGAWGVAVTAPVIDRDHVHIHNHRGQQFTDQWQFKRLGDAKVIGRYQLPHLGNPLRPATAGILFGLKLPTGQTDVKNREGDVAERSLQPGTGTTDLILGGFHHQKLIDSNGSWFAQVQYQQPLSPHREFKPGGQLWIDAGYRHALTDRLGALLQANILAKRRDSGAEAESEDSGGRFISLSPGISYAVSDTIQMYGFFQKPLYQHVNGVQLTANKAFVVGMSGRF